MQIRLKKYKENAERRQGTSAVRKYIKTTRDVPPTWLLLCSNSSPRSFQRARTAPHRCNTGPRHKGSTPISHWGPVVNRTSLEDMVPEQRCLPNSNSPDRKKTTRVGYITAKKVCSVILKFILELFLTTILNKSGKKHAFWRWPGKTLKQKCDCCDSLNVQSQFWNCSKNLAHTRQWLGKTLKWD